MLLQSRLFRTKPVAMTLMALGGLLLSTAASLAEIRQTTISQSTFESRCRQMGGTLETGGTPQIKICKLPGGQVAACDFSTSPAYCDVRRPTPALRNMLGVPPGGDRVQEGGGGKPAVGGDTSAPGTVN